jgi:heme oxygenase (mycobilin-producing)
MFVTINYITCQNEYHERFEFLLSTRAGAIDRMEGFQKMEVMKPLTDGDHYLIITYWNSEDDFLRWKNSPEFMEGHKRGFGDISHAKSEGKEPPMVSNFRTYQLFA